MKIRQAVFPVALLGLLLLVGGCDSKSSMTPPVAKADNLETGAQLNSAGIGVAVADLDGNGVPDIVIAGPNGIRIFKNPIPQKK